MDGHLTIRSYLSGHQSSLHKARKIIHLSLHSGLVAPRYSGACCNDATSRQRGTAGTFILKYNSLQPKYRCVNCLFHVAVVSTVRAAQRHHEVHPGSGLVFDVIQAPPERRTQTGWQSVPQGTDCEQTSLASRCIDVFCANSPCASNVCFKCLCKRHGIKSRNFGIYAMWKLTHWILGNKNVFVHN